MSVRVNFNNRTIDIPIIPNTQENLISNQKSILMFNKSNTFSNVKTVPNDLKLILKHEYFINFEIETESHAIILELILRL